MCDYEIKELSFGPKDEKPLEFRCQIEQDAIKGAYLAGIFVRNEKGQVVHTIGKKFEVEPEPKDDVKKGELKDPHGGKKVPIRVNLKLGTFKDNKLVRYFPGEVNTVYINYKHETTEFIRKITPKALVYHLVVSASNELIRLKYRQRIETAEEGGQELTSDRMKQLVDEMVGKSED